MSNDWYRKMAFYQIWIRSFKDGNSDGIGDLYGVYEKLDYIKSLGVDGIWFSPIYPSPNADFGYDISDYRDIHPDYGDLDQFKKVLHRAHELGLKVIMDLVVNHTSDEHFWFQESRKGKDNPYSDYYIWRDKPNNWDSLFEGKAWTYDEMRGQYYLHIFQKKQPDLNMDNPKVREEVKSNNLTKPGVIKIRLGKIIADSEIELPEAMVETQVDSMVRDYSMSLRQSGMRLDDYLKFSNMTEEQLRTQMRPDAEDRLKGSLVLEEIAEVEKLEVTDEDIDKKLEEMASMYGMSVDSFKKDMPDSERDRLKKEISMEKAIDVILDNKKETKKRDSKKKAEEASGEE